MLVCHAFVKSVACITQEVVQVIGEGDKDVTQDGHARSRCASRQIHDVALTRVRDEVTPVLEDADEIGGKA